MYTKKYTKLTSPNPLFALSWDLRLNKTIKAPGLFNEKQPLLHATPVNNFDMLYGSESVCVYRVFQEK